MVRCCRLILYADVSGLWLFLHNTKFTKAAVTLAPTSAIRDTAVEAYSVVSSNNIFTVQPTSQQALLQNVYLRQVLRDEGVLLHGLHSTSCACSAGTLAQPCRSRMHTAC